MTFQLNISFPPIDSLFLYEGADLDFSLANHHLLLQPEVNEIIQNLTHQYLRNEIAIAKHPVTRHAIANPSSISTNKKIHKVSEHNNKAKITREKRKTNNKKKLEN